MDSIRRRPKIDPPKVTKPAPAVPQKPPLSQQLRPVETPVRTSRIRKSPFPKRFFRWRFLLGAFALLFLLSLGFLLYRGLKTVSSIQVQNNGQNTPLSLREKIQSLQQTLLPFSHTPLKGEDRGRINVLLLGKADEDSPGKNLTDTIMLASIDTKERRVALLSIPRDLWVPIGDSQSSTKINALYQYGLDQNQGFEPLKEAVTLVTDEPVDYVFMVDFHGFESAIDAIGGISVDVPKDFYDPLYPGKNYSYETFELKKGWQKLDGATALKYARERHDDPEGDFGRAKRQQQVLQAVKNKVFSPGTFLNFFKLYDLFVAFEKNVQTDISPEELRSFYELSKVVDTHNITNVVFDAWKPESLLRVDHQMLGGLRAFILVPRVGTWSETREVAKNIFDLQTLQERKAEIAQEDATLLIVHRGNDAPEAAALARYLSTEVGIKTTVAGPEVLRGTAKQGILWAHAGTEKIYSLDELLKLLPVSKGDTAAEPELRKVSDADFVLTMSDELQAIFTHASDLGSDAESQEGDFPQFKQ